MNPKAQENNRGQSPAHAAEGSRLIGELIAGCEN